MISRSALAWLAVAVSTFGFSAAEATAGTYDVTPNPCGSWAGYGANGWGAGIGCLNGYSAFQLNSGDGLSVGSPGTFMWLKSPRLPDATYLESLTLSYASSQATLAVGNIQARGCQRYTGSTDVWSGGANGECVGAVFDLPNQGNFGSRLIGAGELVCGTNCGGWQLNAKSGATSGFVWLNALTASIGDTAAPIVTSQLAIHEISQGGWLRGTVEFGATGSDTNGSGIKAMAFMPGAPMLSILSTSNCDYSQWIPCSVTRDWNGAFDTTVVSDGSHTGHYTATDTGGNTSQSSSFAYKTDNTNPTTPSDVAPVVAGMNGWSSVNSVGASWTNGAEVDEDSTHSGLDKVTVDVNPTDGAQPDPAPVTVPIGDTTSGISATRTGISGVTLPAAGAWTMRLQLVDKAGNVSDVGDGSGSSADSDISVGYDPNPPAVPQGQANGWISRDELAAGYDQSFTYTAPPNSLAPICGFASTTDKNINGTAGSTINVPGGGTRKVRLEGTLEEATHYVHLRAIACNGVASLNTSTTEAKVDRTDPVGTIVGVENGKWYRDGKVVELRGSDALSGMEPAPQSDSRSTKGAYLAYTVNGTGPEPDVAPRGDSISISVTSEGQKELQFSPVDFAGNMAAARSATFGVDATNPTGHIHRQDPARPTLLSAHLADAPSGVSYAVFSVRPAGGGESDWIQLPTSLAGIDGKAVGIAVESGTATARFPDTSLGRGTYDVRVTAYDQAGNPIATQRHQDGSPATVSNPMRSATAVNVKLFKALRTCGTRRCVVKKCTKRSQGACYRILKGKVVLQGGSSSATSAYNRGAIATGVVTDERGRPIPGADVDVTTTELFSKKEKHVESISADGNGIFALRIPAGVNRKVKVRFAGNELRRESSSTARLESRPRLKLRINKRRARTGQTVTFSGRVRSLDRVFPAGGKIVALQFYAAKRWRPAVGVAHTDRLGRFKFKYKFDGVKVRAKIIFRVVAPSEDTWGHAYGSSKPVKIYLN